MDMGPAVAQSKTDKDKSPLHQFPLLLQLHTITPPLGVASRTAPDVVGPSFRRHNYDIGQQKWFRSRFCTSFSTKLLMTLNELKPVRRSHLRQ